MSGSLGDALYAGLTFDRRKELKSKRRIMKLFGFYFYLVSTPVLLSKDQRRALRRGWSHVHGNPVRKPLIKIIEDKKAECERAN